ncbi:MAG: hypothetical protein V3U21_05495 [Thermodesulfobacteriota bacterium]
MKTTSTIIKDIEQYFLNLSQKGIMLSSRDYHLITEWIEKGISKEQILKGIRDTFQSKDIKRIRNLYDCSELVERSSKKKETIATKTVQLNPDNNNYLVQILNNFNNLIQNNSKSELNNFYVIINDKLKHFINSNNDEMFSNINKLEEEFFLKFPEHLNAQDMTNFKAEINNFINSGNDYINEKSKNKALNNYSKNFIITNYLGINPFEL